MYRIVMNLGLVFIGWQLALNGVIPSPLNALELLPTSFII